MDWLQDAYSRYDIEEALAKLLDSSDALEALSLAYDRVMLRINEQGRGASRLAKRVLGWITNAQCLMTVTELRHALAIQLDTSDFNMKCLNSIEDILSVCAGLVIIGDDNTVRLVHYTTQDYLKRTEEQHLPTAKRDIAAACITYLLYDSFESGWIDPYEREDLVVEVVDYPELKDLGPAQGVGALLKARLNQYPLLRYTARYWTAHAKRFRQESINNFVMRLCSDSRRVSSIMQILLLKNTWRHCFPISGPAFDKFGSATPCTAMHLASFLGADDIVSQLLRNGSAPDERDLNNGTPLWWAAWRGHTVVMEVLLANENSSVDVNIKDDKYGKTPLLIAAQKGHEKTVAFLLEQNGIDINLPDLFEYNPLLLAAMSGRDTIVEMLLSQSKIQVNYSGDSGTVLTVAAKFGRERIIRLLLRRKDVDFNLRSRMNLGKTALGLAVEYGHPNVVRMLLASDEFDVNLKDDRGNTPLLRASRLGQRKIVKMLLSRDDTDVNRRNADDETALSAAAKQGHVEIVSFLLAVATMDLESKSEEGQDLVAQIESGKSRIRTDPRNELELRTKQRLALDLIRTAVEEHSRHKASRAEKSTLAN